MVNARYDKRTQTVTVEMVTKAGGRQVFIIGQNCERSFGPSGHGPSRSVGSFPAYSKSSGGYGGVSP